MDSPAPEKQAHWFFTAARSRRRRVRPPTKAELVARRKKRLSKSAVWQRYLAEKRENQILRRLILNYIRLRNSPLPSHTLRTQVAKLAVAAKIRI
jgi:hypothetical protein